MSATAESLRTAITAKKKVRNSLSQLKSTSQKGSELQDLVTYGKSLIEVDTKLDEFRSCARLYDVTYEHDLEPGEIGRTEEVAHNIRELMISAHHDYMRQYADIQSGWNKTYLTSDHAHDYVKRLTLALSQDPDGMLTEGPTRPFPALMPDSVVALERTAFGSRNKLPPSYSRREDQ